MSLPIRSEVVEVHKVTLDNVIENYHPLIQTEWEFYNHQCPKVFEGTFEKCSEFAAKQVSWKWRFSKNVYGGYWWNEVSNIAYMPV